MLILFHQEEGEEEKKQQQKRLSGKNKPEEYYGRAVNLTFLK